ncbi:NAD(P)H-binding protein [Aquincola sp. S2]|uniref:NAD(P)H-binding protein n=1 Tax=Pseudaquabacterium terrae TaxID=2732868 RepID=A0ABX2ET03_9BURK|nr:NAD(P)H-binding protein [Aquabacterium terrae]NRF71840.1 NAD(P)H-binding protein [Aquabacterium terrae]
MQARSRRAWLAGATGLVGRALLEQLVDNPQYERLQVLARRAAPQLAAAGKLQLHVVDFDRLPALPPADDVFIALGTTIKVAGSEQAFRRVDFDAVVNTARAGRSAGAKRLAVVSALGADATSAVFYNGVKGEMEEAVAQLGYETVVIAQPSLLVGDRAALGQPLRFGEAWALKLLRPVMGFVPRGVRPIAAEDVARAMLRVMSEAPKGVHVLRSGQMQPAR